jgi:hypothetical protein
MKGHGVGRVGSRGVRSLHVKGNLTPVVDFILKMKSRS